MEFDPVADGGMGLLVKNGGTFNAQGLSRTSGKDVVSCKLNTDEAAAQTVLGVDTDTGWLNADQIVIAPTTQTATQVESRTMSGNATATEITVTAGLTNAHSGTSPTQAEIILLTRNVIVRSATATLMTYCTFTALSTVNIDWTEFYYLGENGAGKRGIDSVNTNSGFNMQYCSVHDCEDNGVNIGGSSGSSTFSNNVCYNLNTTSASTLGGAIFAAATIADNNIFLALSGNVTSGCSVSISANNLTLTNNTFAGCNTNGSNGILKFSANNVIGTISGNTIHSFNGHGIDFSAIFTAGGTLTNTTIWRGTGRGIITTGTAPIYWYGLIFDTLTLFGCTTTSVNLPDYCYNIIFNNLTSNGDSTFTTTNGVLVATSDVAENIFFNSCDFSTVSGIKTAHTNDFNVTTNSNIEIVASNTKMGGTNAISGQTAMSIISRLLSSKHGQTAGTHKSWFRYGIIQTDTTIADAGISQRLTPNNASNKLESGSKKVAVANAGTVTVTVKVRESVVGDGTDYNGNRIRLLVKRNDAAGITADTVLATATVTSEGAFETLSGTTAAVTDDAVLEFVCDCDGTTGWVNLDTWTTS